MQPLPNFPKKKKKQKPHLCYYIYHQMQKQYLMHTCALQESHSPRPNGEHVSMEVRDRESLNGERLEKPSSSGIKQERPPSRSGSSSSRSTPSLKTKDVSQMSNVEPRKC